MPPRPPSDAQDAVYCPKCKRENEEFNPRCRFCGERLSRDSRPASAVATLAATGSPPSIEALTSGQRVGPYRLTGLLGRGGMGIVYRAIDEHSGQVVALKTLTVPHETLLRGIRREIHSLARIRHPGVVRILAEGLDEGIPWYAMELLEGRSLRRYRQEVLAQGRPVEPSGPRAKAEHTLTAPTEIATTPTELSQESRTSSGPSARTLQLTSPELDAGRSAETSQQLTSPGRDRDPPGGTSVLAAGRPSHILGEDLLTAILTLVRQLCAPLAYLHGEGIVHRDLKPDNVLVRPDARPIIIDFGLASQFSHKQGREALEIGSRTAGTLTYMAPEQIRGELVDARADLYALGCILYELLTNRPPFVGNTPLDVIQQHLNVLPMAPSQMVQGVSEEVDMLVFRLLEKKPRERFGHADDVAAALVQLGAQTRRADAGPRSRAYLYRPGFAGREEALQQLDGHFASLLSGPGSLARSRSHRREVADDEKSHAARAGVGGLVLLGGESGVGKTRLAMELAHRATRLEIQVLAGECTPLSPQPATYGGAEGLHALRRPLQAIADRCREHGVAETEHVFGRRGKVLAVYEPALASLPGQDVYPEPAELPAEAARLRLFSDLTETFAAMAQPQPLLLVLDDLQWADGLTLGWLEYLLRGREFERLELLVLGLYRTEEIAESLLPLVQSPSAVHLKLGRLDEPAVGTMISEMLALAPPPELFVRFLAHHSEGNPFFVAEYLHTAVAEGVLWRDELGRWQVAGPVEGAATEALYEELPLPNSLRQLVSRRLERLSPVTRRLVEATAVIGREAPVEWLTTMLGAEPGSLFEAVAEALGRRVLEEVDVGSLRFVHDKLREVAYEELESGNRARLHGVAAEAIGALGAAERDQQLAPLGRHWEMAGNLVQARDAYLAAARLAVRQYSHDEAQRLYRRYLRLVGERDCESVRARLELGDDLAAQGLSREAQAEFELALSDARACGDPDKEEAWLLHRLGRIALDRRTVDVAEVLLAKALEIAQELGIQRRQAKLLEDFALLYWLKGRVQDAHAIYDEALRMSRELGDRKTSAAALANLATLCLEHGRLDEAEVRFQQALSILRDLGERRLEAMVLSNLAALQEQRGQLSEAQSLYQKVNRLANEIGDRLQSGTALTALALIAQLEGRLDDADRLYAEALEVERPLDNPHRLGLTLGNYGILRLQQGRVVEAWRLLNQALDIAREIGDFRFEGVWCVYLARFERQLGGTLEARAQADRGVALARKAGHPSDILVALCEQGHLTIGEGGSPRLQLEEARAIARSIGAGPRSEMGQALGRLERAEAAFAGGQTESLSRGDLIDDIPEGLRRRLMDPELSAPGALDHAVDTRGS